MHYDTNIDWLIEKCSHADSFAELVQIAMDELHKFPTGAEVVCGPISTGGRGSLEANFQVFGATILKLKQIGRPIFSQVPYEERISFFRHRWYDLQPSQKGRYYTPILDEFYHPLIQSRLIKKGWFIPGWESSTGAVWERRQLQNVHAEIEDLTPEWIDSIMQPQPTEKPSELLQ